MNLLFLSIERLSCCELAFSLKHISKRRGNAFCRQQLFCLKSTEVATLTGKDLLTKLSRKILVNLTDLGAAVVKNSPVN